MMEKCVVRSGASLRLLFTQPVFVITTYLLLCGPLATATRLRNSKPNHDLTSLFSNKDAVLALNRNNNHRPVILNCSNYAPVVKEEEPIGTVVIQVQAEDKDPEEEGGTITYSLMAIDNKNMKFEINNKTGVIRTTHILDWDEPAREKEVYLIVVVTDNGRPQLSDHCMFKVTIEDVNDNAPVFRKGAYVESVSLDLPIDHEVMRVFATDIDDGNNSVIRYSLSFNNPEESAYFRINSRTGSIFLNKVIDSDLEILVVSHKKPPIFEDNNTISISLLESFDNFAASLASIKAFANIDVSTIPDNLYRAIGSCVSCVFIELFGRTEDMNTFRLEINENVADIKLKSLLDYEKIKQYSLIVRVKNSYGLIAEKAIKINIIDVNDNMPRFFNRKEGSVLENEPAGTPVMQVKAIDRDGTTENNEVTYELKNFKDFFAIDPQSGNITTLKMFDREEDDIYGVKVIAKDKAPSTLFKNGEPNKGEQVLQISIHDKNDNPPHFTRNVYTNNLIKENAKLNETVTIVKAIDSDTTGVITYSIISGNINDSFRIEATSGEIRVKNRLDYEKITKYNLTVRAFDGVFNDTALVEIIVKSN